MNSNTPFGGETYDLGDVLDALMLEEPKPTHDALSRWCERFPQYRQELADFFATWAMQDAMPPENVLSEAAQQRIVDAGVRYGLDILRRQGRLAPAKAKTEAPQPMDQLVLAAIFLLRTEAWSGKIVEKVSDMSEKPVMFGPVFSSLQRLQDGCFVAVRLVREEGEPESRSRRYFTITRSGEHALALAKETSKVVAGFLADFA